VTFSHWEQTPAGLAAVYRYSVPKAASHYTVNYCCYRQQDSAQTILLLIWAAHETSKV